METPRDGPPAQETYVTVSVGRAWHIYDAGRMLLKLIGPQVFLPACTDTRPLLAAPPWRGTQTLRSCPRRSSPLKSTASPCAAT